jgi:hypothetical protein
MVPVLYCIVYGVTTSLRRVVLLYAGRCYVLGTGACSSSVFVDFVIWTWFNPPTRTGWLLQGKISNRWILWKHIH